jgi:hypothetical protein
MVPAIYVRSDPPRRLPLAGRLLAIGIALAALAVLVTAASIVPDGRGMRTHEQLGMQPCSFLYRTGYPCMGCGMTTSFSHFVRGQWPTSFFIQPMGFALAVVTAMAVWAGLYVGLTGRPSHRLLRIVPMKWHLWVWLPLAVLAWAWKIAVVAAGH